VRENNGWGSLVRAQRAMVFLHGGSIYSLSVDQSQKGAAHLTRKETKQKSFHKQGDYQGASAVGEVLIILVLSGLWIRRVIQRYLSGRHLTENGYVFRRGQSGHDQYEHRLIAEQILGRNLAAWEVVHHINGRRSDNRLSNLCVMDHCDHDSYHQWYEWVFNTYGNYPRRETQLQKLRESFNGKILSEFVRSESE
jgi:hypothetical protein